MKTVKNTTSKKQTKSTKKTKPEFIVDFTNIENEKDALYRFASAKFNNDIDNFIYGEADALMSHFHEECIDQSIKTLLIETDKVFVIGGGKARIINNPNRAAVTVIAASVNTECKQKKPNIVKRFWSWITRKK